MAKQSDSKIMKDIEYHRDVCNACKEYQELARRARSRSSRSPSETAGIPGSTIMPAWLPGIAVRNGARQGGAQPDILVTCFWRGGPDMLAQTVPYGDPFLYAAPYDGGPGAYYENGLRPNIGLLPPDAKDPDPQAMRCEELGEVGGDVFGVHKAFADTTFNDQAGYNSIYELFQANEVAFIVAAGSPDTNRSHFSAEAYIEFGTPNQPHDEVTGWLARYLIAVAPGLGGPLRGAALSHDRLIPKMMAFAEKTLAFKTVNEVELPGNDNTAAARTAILQARYGAQTDDPLRGTVLNAFEIIDRLQDVDVSPDPLAMYTNSDFGNRLKNAAALIKAGVEVEAVYLSRPGWDNHASISTYKDGAFYNRIKDISQNLAAFRIDLQSDWQRITVACQGEFGRQINENADLGTDHGNAGVMMVMGGGVNGGVYAKRSMGGPDGWPGLDPGLLIDNDAVRTTIDYRAVFAEILRKRALLDPQVISDFIFNTNDEVPPPVLDELGVVNEITPPPR